MLTEVWGSQPAAQRPVCQSLSGRRDFPTMNKQRCFNSSSFNDNTFFGRIKKNITELVIPYFIKGLLLSLRSTFLYFKNNKVLRR